MDTAHYLALGRTCIYHDFVVRSFFLELIQDLRQHSDCRTDRNRNHDDVGPAYAFLERNYFISQAHLLRSGSIDRIILDTEDGIGKSSSLEVYSHRTADET